MNNQIVRVGVIGAGAVASSVHLPILTRRSDLFAVAAIADFNIAAANLLAAVLNSLTKYCRAFVNSMNGCITLEIHLATG